MNKNSGTRVALKDTPDYTPEDRADWQVKRRAQVTAQGLEI